MMEWMLLPYKRLYAAIAGRSSRREYWMFVLLNLIIAAVYIGLFVMAGGMALLNPQSLAGGFAGAGMVMLLLLAIPLYLWAIVSGAASFALTIRRFHDLGLSGWAYLVFLIVSLIPLINLASWLVLLVMMCIKGTNGPNRYGPDPTQEDPSRPTTVSDVFS